MSLGREGGARGECPLPFGMTEVKIKARDSMATLLGVDPTLLLAAAPACPAALSLRLRGRRSGSDNTNNTFLSAGPRIK